MDGIERRMFDDPDWISEFQTFPVDRMAGVKGAENLIIVLLLVFLTLPVMLLSAVSIKLDSPGPVGPRSHERPTNAGGRRFADVVSYQKGNSIQSGITACAQTKGCRGYLDTIAKLSPLVRHNNSVSSSFVCSEGCY
jgi:hypothetical protein